MILYKYVTFETAKIILESSSLSFSNLEDFNDPFECTGLGLINPSVSVGISTMAIRNRFSRKYAVLALTRNPLNLLMWSHYADSYNGVVIGIDTQNAGFEDSKKYVIPAQKGHITYIRTMPRSMNEVDVDTLRAIGNSETINLEKTEQLLQHVFLYKHLDWAYEEEARIVKNINAANFAYHPKGFDNFKECILDGDVWQRIQLEVRPVYSVKIPSEAFVDVTVGDKMYVNLKRKQEAEHRKNKQLVPYTYEVEKHDEFFAVCKKLNLKCYRTEIDYETWQLKRRPLHLINAD